MLLYTNSIADYSKATLFVASGAGNELILPLTLEQNHICDGANVGELFQHSQVTVSLGLQVWIEAHQLRVTHK